MRYYFRTRHTVGVIAAALLLSLGLYFLERPMVIYQDSGVTTFTPGTPFQVLLVGSLALGLSSRTEQFEFSGIRSLPFLRFINAGLLTLVGTLLAAGLATTSGAEDLTVGSLSPVRAFIGLCGIALAAVSFTDMRLGALCSLPLVLIPVAFDLQNVPFGDVVGFVLADDGLVPWVTAVTLLIAGLLLYSLGYSERNSPSVERQAIIDSRSGRRIRAANR